MILPIDHTLLSEEHSIQLVEFLSSKLQQTRLSRVDLWEKILSGSEVLIRLSVQEDEVTGVIGVLGDIRG